MSGGLWRVLAVLAATAMLTGCVAIPRSGPVTRADQTTTRASSQVEIAPQPPAADASPRRVVEGFLQAMAAYEPDYATAREYLAPEARAAWQPQLGVTVYADGHAPQDVEGRIVLEAPVIGRTDARGVFTPVAEQVSTDFGLQQNADGQWRITDPPQGLLVSKFVFTNFFGHVDLYWPEPGGRFLVPEPVSVAQGQLSPTSLVQSIVVGPGEWLGPAVRTALPGDARLNRSVAVDETGVASVDLSGSLHLLDLPQRRALAGQLAWTLGQVPAVTGIRILQNGADLPLGEVAGTDGIIRSEDVQALSPVPSALDTHLFAVTEGRVIRVDQSEQTVAETPVAGRFGEPGSTAELLAVASAGDKVAVVSGGGSRVTGVDLATGTSVFDLFGFDSLKRPQYARTGELWLLSGQPGSHRVQVVADGTLQDVDAQALVGQRILAFRLSPDGVRLALVLEREGRPVLALARVDRGPDGIRVDALRDLPLYTTAQTELTAVRDVGWGGPGVLVVLGVTEEANQPSPYQLDLNDISVQQIGQADRWQATSIATLPSPESTRMVILGQQGRAWRYEDDFTWPEMPRPLSAAAYPG